MSTARIALVASQKQSISALTKTLPEAPLGKPEPWFGLHSAHRVRVAGKREVVPSQKSASGHCHLSAVFQSEIVVHGMAEFLLAAEIPLGCLNRCVAKEKLNLLKFSACETA